MAEIKWIKIVTDIFNNRKIRQIETMPEADTLIVIWFKLLCLAGQTNDAGQIYFMEDYPYDAQMLSSLFARPVNTVQLALKVFEKFNMIEFDERGVIWISNWEKYQSIEEMERIKEINRARAKRFYDKKKAERLMESSQNSVNSNDSNVIPNVRPNVRTTLDLTHTNDTDIDIDRDIDRDRDNILFAPSDLIAPSRQPESEAVYRLPLNDGTAYGVTQTEVDQYRSLYPAVDVDAEYRKMIGWLEANPTRRKTKNGIKRFVNSWLAKEQDAPHPAQSIGYQKKPKFGDYEQRSYDGMSIGIDLAAEARKLEEQGKG